MMWSILANVLPILAIVVALVLALTIGVLLWHAARQPGKDKIGGSAPSGHEDK